MAQATRKIRHFHENKPHERRQRTRCSWPELPLAHPEGQKALADMTSGQILRILTTDAGSVRDFKAFAHQTGNELVHQESVVASTSPLAQTPLSGWAGQSPCVSSPVPDDSPRRIAHTATAQAHGVPRQFQAPRRASWSFTLDSVAEKSATRLRSCSSTAAGGFDHKGFVAQLGVGLVDFVFQARTHPDAGLLPRGCSCASSVRLKAI